MPNAKELGRMLQSYQATGNTSYEEPEDVVMDFDDNPNPFAGGPVLNQINQTPLRGMRHGDIELGTLGEALMNADQNVTTKLDTPAMAEAGWGTKPRYDLRTGFYDDMNLEDARAREQSAFWKIGNGALKGAVTAGTTAVNTVAGTVWGIGEGLFELGNQVLSGQGIDLGKVIDAGVNNRLSEQMMKLQRLSEEWFPNYRTEQEQSEQYQREWWKHIGTANFIGDSFLKNFGFTVGAMIGGAAWSSVLGRAMSMKASNDLLKGAIAAAEGDAEASNLLKEALSVLKRTGGRADTVIPENILKNLADAAKTFRKKSAILQLSGATIAAMGEGTTEGIMAKDEFLEEYMPRLEQQYSEAYENIQQDVIRDHPEWCSPGLGYDEYGNVRDDVPILTDPRGFEEVARRQNEMSRKYQEIQLQVGEQADRLSGTTFLLNLPLLTATNTIEFGRMFAGGWKSARKAIATTGEVKIGEEGVTSTLERAGMGAGAKAALNSAKVGLSEMSEEMIQGVFSSGAKRVADDRLTSFNDDGFDPERMANYGSWIRSMYEGGKDYLIDPKNWQEGFMGLVTSLIGVPGIPGVAGSRWNGGVYGAVSEARAQVAAERDAVDKFNELVNDKEFVERWKSYIRHMKYNAEMERAAGEDNEYAWHTADEKQLINDIMLFDELGRLGDLEEVVNRYADLSSASKEELEDIRNVIAKGDGIEAKKISDEQLAERVAKQAKRMKDTINEYREIYDEFSARVPVGTSPEQVKEMVFTAANMKRFEHRFLDMFGEVMHDLEPILKYTAETGEGGENAVSFEQLYNGYASFFTSALPRSASVFDQIFKIQREGSLKALYDFVSFDEEMQKKVDDMIKLMHDREAFYNKLIRLEDLKPGEYEEKAKSVDGEAKKQQAAVQAAETNASNQTVAEREGGIDAIRSLLASMPNGKRRAMIKLWSGMQNPPAGVKEYLDLYSTSQDFADFAKSIMTQPGLDFGHGVVHDLVETMLDSSGSVEDFLKFDVSPLTDDNGAAIDRALGDVAAYTALSPEQKQILKEAIPGMMKKIGEAYNANARPLTEEEYGELVASLRGVKVNKPGQRGGIEVPGVSLPEGFEMPRLGRGVVTPVEQAPVQAQPVQPAPTPAQPASSNSNTAKETPISFGKQTGAQTARAAAGMAEPSAAEKIAKKREGQKAKANYIRTAFGEIALGSIDDLNEALGKDKADEKKAALAKVVFKKTPIGDELKKYLDDHDAFTNIIDIKPGDEISLVIDPAYTAAKAGEEPIFLYHGDDCIGVLPGPNRPFSGIKELDKAVRDAYKKSREKEEGTKFTFKHKAPVWGKAKGVFDLIYKEYADVPLIRPDGTIDGYDENAPIVAIDGKGNPILLRGDESVLADFNKYLDKEYPGNKRDSIRGTFYYLADNGVRDRNGSTWFTPLRLNIEHLRPAVFASSQAKTVADVEAWFDELRSLMNEVVTKIGTEPADDVYEDAESKIRTLAQKLAGLVDIHNIYFNIGGDQNGMPMISINWNNLSREDYEKAKAEGNMDKFEKNVSKFSFNSAGSIDKAIDKLKKKLLESKHSFQVNLSDAQQANADFDRLLGEGLVTINANSLHPYNVDVFMEPWVDGKFQGEQYQEEEIEKYEKQESEPEPAVAKEELPRPVTPEEPVVPEENNASSFGFGSEGDEDSPDETPRHGKKSKQTLDVAEPSEDKAREAINAHRTEIYNSLIYPDANQEQISDAVDGIIAAASQGPKAAERVRQALIRWKDMSVSVFDHTDDFNAVLNLVLTSEEKASLAKALSGVYKKEPADIDTLSILRAYNIWSLTRVLPTEDNKSAEILKRAFSRIEGLSESAPRVLASFSDIVNTVGAVSDSYSNGEKIGFLNPLDDFNSLPKEIKDDMIKKGKDPDVYNSGTKEIKDKMLRCAGV